MHVYVSVYVCTCTSVCVCTCTCMCSGNLIVCICGIHMYMVYIIFMCCMFVEYQYNRPGHAWPIICLVYIMWFTPELAKYQVGS